MLLGFAVGGATQTVPMYMAVLAPKRIRGRLVLCFQLAIGVGIVIATLVGATESVSWRTAIGAAAVPALVMLVLQLRLGCARPPVRQHAAPAGGGTPSMLNVRPILPKIEGGRVQGLLQFIEDGIHLVVAAFLVLLAGFLTAGVLHEVIRSAQGPYREETVVLSALDNGLVLFIVAELLHTVRLTIRNQTLDAEPFLVVGLIAGIRKVLIVTAEAEKSFRWNVEGIELLILAALILVMATAGYVWRRSTRPGDYFPLQEERRPPAPTPSSTSVRGS
ncbi:phosphate-starvation-inducible PsiE family protein [Streptomyces sp. NPDC004008]